MNPTNGRIVNYNTTEEERKRMENHSSCNVQMQLPAMIVAVWGNDENTLVNLKVFCDGDLNLWKTSVPRGDLEAQWNWPVITE
jgi:hypothetical protein